MPASPDLECGLCGYLSLPLRESKTTRAKRPVVSQEFVLFFQITHEGDQSVLVNRLTVTSSRSQAIAELEYHVPAIGKGTGRVRSHDVSQVWAFRGAPARIQAIAQSLLSPEV